MESPDREVPLYVFVSTTDSDIGTHVYHEKSAALNEGLLSTTRKEWALGEIPLM